MATKPKKAPAPYKIPALVQLLKQINGFAPKRSKASDGWIGDAAHSARKSDHNPDPDGSVDAIDVTHDPKGGVDIAKLADALIASKDRRISYLIFNGTIVSGTGQSKPAWVRRKYTGANKHTKHIHISVKDEWQEDTTDWRIASAFGKADAPTPPPPPPPPKVQSLGREDIVAMQERLTELGYPLGGADGVIGPLTKEAILAFKKDNALPANFEADETFLSKLVTAEPRKMLPARAEAAPAVVTAKIPEANAHWWNKWLGGGIGAGAGGLGILDAIAPAQGYIEPVREFASDVPGWAWLAIIAAVAIGIWYFASRGEKASVEAYRDGSRR